MPRETQQVDIIKPQENLLYSEKEILRAWNEVGQEHNGLTFTWLVEKLRGNKRPILEKTAMPRE